MKQKLVSVTASELVIIAIHELESMKLHESGPTSKDILELILNKYKVSNREIKVEVREALLRGVTFGILSEKDGRYRLEDVPEPPLKFEMSEGNMNDPQDASAAPVFSTISGKRKNESGTTSGFKGKRKSCRECGKKTKRSRMKSDSEPEGNETNVEEENP